MNKEVKTRVIVIGAVLLIFGLWTLNSNQTKKTENKFDLSKITTTADTPKTEKNSNGCYTTDVVRNHYGENACVEFTVGYTYKTKAGTKFIDEKVNYKDGFVIYVPRDSNFSTVDLEKLKGKTLRVTGLIEEYSGYPQIKATEYSQVGTLSN